MKNVVGLTLKLSGILALAIVSGCGGDHYTIGGIETDKFEQRCIYKDKNGQPKAEEAKTAKEYALIGGSFKGIHIEDNNVDTIFINLEATALEQGLKVCVYPLTQENWNLIAANQNLFSLLYIGHGVDGNITSRKNSKLLKPENLPTFNTPLLKRVTLVSCEAGRKAKEWQKLFPKDTEIYSSVDDLEVQASFRYIMNDIPTLLLKDLGLDNGQSRNVLSRVTTQVNNGWNPRDYQIKK